MMQEQDEPEFTAAMAKMSAALRQEIGADTYESFWEIFGHWDLEQFESACRRASAELKFFPKPVELRDLGGVMTTEDRAIKAWECVVRSLGSVGTYNSVQFDDPVINATIRNMGGWIALGQKPHEEFVVWGRKEFEKIYNSVCRTGVTEEAGEYLFGIEERQNIGVYEPKPPCLVITGLPEHSAEVVRKIGSGNLQLVRGAG